MNGLIESVFVAFGVDSKGVDQGLKEANAKLDRGVSKIKSIIAPIAGTLAFAALYRNYTQGADALGKFSQSVGLSIQEVDAWGQAVVDAGGNAQSFQSTLDSLNRKIIDATSLNRKGAQALFKEFDISLKNANGTIRSSIDVLEELAGQAETIDKNKFISIAQKLGIDRGTIQLLQQGKTTVAEIVDEFRQYAYTDEDARIAAEHNSELQRLQLSYRRVSNILLRMVVPYITLASKHVRGFSNYLSRHQKAAHFFFAGLATILTVRLIPAFIRLAAVILLNPLTWLIGLIFAAALIFEDWYKYIRTGSSGLKEFWDILYDGESGLKDFIGLFNDAHASLEGFPPLLRLIADLVLTPFTLIASAGKAISDNWEDATSWLKEFFSTVDRYAKSAKEKLGSILGFFGVSQNTPTQQLAPSKVANAVDEVYALAGLSFGSGQETNTDVTFNGGIHINGANMSDAAQIASKIEDNLEDRIDSSFVNKFNPGVRQ